MLSVKAHAPVIWDRPAIVTETIPVNGLGTGERARATDPVGSGRPQHQQVEVDCFRTIDLCVVRSAYRSNEIRIRPTPPTAMHVNSTTLNQ